MVARLWTGLASEVIAERDGAERTGPTMIRVIIAPGLVVLRR